jgi:hypothetical protein
MRFLEPSIPKKISDGIIVMIDFWLSYIILNALINICGAFVPNARALTRKMGLSVASLRMADESHFETLKRLDERIASLSDRSPEYLLSFWNASIATFVIDATVTEPRRPSIIR